MTNGVTDDIVGIQGTRMPWFKTRLGPEKRKKRIHLIYVLYILYVIYIVYILYAYYISYILHIYVESKVSGKSIGLHLQHILWNPTDGVTDDIVWIQGTRMPWFNIRLGPEKRKKSIHLIYVLYILYAYYISYILHIFVESKVRGI